jgi:hypothetical protein
MAKIVVSYDDGDGYTYCYENVVPLEYESAEAFIVAFDEWAKGCIALVEGTSDCPHGSFTVGLHKFDIQDFRSERSKPSFDHSKDRKWDIYLPDVYTLEEWFDRNRKN